MQNTDVLIKKKSQPSPLPGQETLKSLLSMVAWMSGNKKAVSWSRALQTGQEMTLHVQSFGATCPEKQNPALQL